MKDTDMVLPQTRNAIFLIGECFNQLTWFFIRSMIAKAKAWYDSSEPEIEFSAHLQCGRNSSQGNAIIIDKLLYILIHSLCSNRD